MSRIVYPEVENYIRSLIPERMEVLKRLEVEAGAPYLPIVPPEVGQFLYFLVSLTKARRILEIGTSVGYSTICMARAVSGIGGRVTTIDVDEKAQIEARKNFKEAGLAEFIELITGDALEILPMLNTSYDLIFLDAAKGQYMEFFKYCYRLLNTGGLFIADNVLYRGKVAETGTPLHKHRTMIRKLQSFLEYLSGHPGLVTVILPFGDGLALCCKRGEIHDS